MPLTNEDRERLIADDLMSSSDVAAALYVTRSTVSNWKKRDVGFPAPVATVSDGNLDLYIRSDIRAWARERYANLYALLTEEN